MRQAAPAAWEPSRHLPRYAMCSGSASHTPGSTAEAAGLSTTTGTWQSGGPPAFGRTWRRRTAGPPSTKDRNITSYAAREWTPRWRPKHGDIEDDKGMERVLIRSRTPTIRTSCEPCGSARMGGSGLVSTEATTSGERNRVRSARHRPRAPRLGRKLVASLMRPLNCVARLYNVVHGRVSGQAYRRRGRRGKHMRHSCGSLRRVRSAATSAGLAGQTLQRLMRDPM